MICEHCGGNMGSCDCTKNVGRHKFVCRECFRTYYCNCNSIGCGHKHNVDKDECICDGCWKPAENNTCEVTPVDM